MIARVASRTAQNTCASRIATDQIRSIIGAVHRQKRLVRVYCAGQNTCKRSVVFLGTPEVATIPLKGLLDAAAAPDASFEVSAVVTQVARARGRGWKNKEPPPTPVHQVAIDYGFALEKIFTPPTARKVEFLEVLEELKPDLCVTAAYGNILSQRFLNVPRCGTINIHPSLLPLYRGAAPVNRCLENGDAETGVSVAYTVLALDAGPVLAQAKVPLKGNEQAPEMLTHLFQLGTDLLIDNLPKIWSGEADALAQPQDESAVTLAPKMAADDAVLDFTQPALVLHNKVRGFAGWPGTRCRIRIMQDGKEDVVSDLKIIRSRVGQGAGAPSDGSIEISSEAVMFPCGDGSMLEATHVQPAGKKVMDAKAFRNGMNGKRVFVEAC